MKTRITLIEVVAFILFLTPTLSFAQGIFENPITGTNPNTHNPYTQNQVLDPNIVTASLGRGSGITGKNKNHEYKADSWSTSAFDENDYFEFTMTPDTGYEMDLISFVYTPKRNNGSVDSFELRSSLDGFISTIDNPIYNAAGVTVDLSSAAFQGINGIITFRLYAWGADNDSKDFSIRDFVFNGTLSSNSLSLGEQSISKNSLSIMEQRLGDVQFKLDGGLSMRSIQIIDLQGRILHDLTVSGGSARLGLDIKGGTVYLAMVQLTDGRVITKKAVKRY